MQAPRLTPTSYIVLGLLDRLGPSTPYELKRAHALGIGNFWTVQHAQFYSEPERLAEAGLLSEEREEGGRRRRVFSITAAGEDALDAWLADPDSPAPELRDVSLIKVFFGADPHAVAERQVSDHEQLLATYEELHAALSLAPDSPRGPISTLEAGIRHERALIAYWRALL